MPYVVTIGAQTYRTTLEANSTEGLQSDSGDRLVVQLEGQPYQLDLRAIAPLASSEGAGGAGGRYSLVIGGRSYEVFAHRLATPDGQGGRTYEIVLAGRRFTVTIEDEREKALASTLGAARESGEAVVRAPMPGLVLALPCEEGARVARGETVAVLEAMKMENDLTSPMSGVIKEIRVTSGQTVNQGDILVVVAGE